MNKKKDEPPNFIENSMDIGSTDIPTDDIKGGRRVGFWHRFTQPILYPAGSSLFTRCGSFLMDIQRR